MGKYRVKKQGTPDTAPTDYTDIYVDETSGRLSTIDDAGVVTEYTNIDDEAKVKADSTDPIPGFLDDKVDGTTIKVNPVTHQMYSDGADIENTVIVQSGESIKDALDGITDASETKPYTILVYPGVYTENNPIQGQSYVNIKGIGGEDTVTVIAQNANENLFDAVGLFFLLNLTLQGVTGATKYAFSHAGTESCLLDGIAFNSCSNAINMNNSAGYMTLRNSTFLDNIGTGALVESGNLNITNLRVLDTATIDIILNITGVNSKLVLNSLVSFSPNVGTGILAQDLSETILNALTLNSLVDGIVIDSGAEIRSTSTTIFDAQNDGIRINDSGTDSLFSCQGCTTLKSANYDVNILSATGTVTGTGQFSSDNVNFVAGAKLIGLVVSDKEDDEGVNVYGEFHVGAPEVGSESVFGEGDSYTRGMLVYTESSVGDFTDVSVIARSASGSTFTFPGITADNAIYVSSSLTNTSDYLEHLGIKFKSTLALVPGTGEVVIEYWNGTTWTEINGMEVSATSPYYPYAKDYFQHEGSHQIRYDNRLAIDSWTKSDPMNIGEDYYWVRYRIETAITTAPIFEQFKLHTNRFEINSDGWVEYFGKARPLTVIPWDYNSFQPFAASPSNQDLFLFNSPVGPREDIGVGRIENSFSAGALDQVGLVIFTPLDMDTSSPLKIRMSYTSNGTGDVEWFVNAGIVKNGDLISTTLLGAETTLARESHTSVISTVAIANTRVATVIELDLSEAICRREIGAADEIWISISRDGGQGNDTLTDIANVIQISPTYTKWCEGGHLA